MFEFFFDILWIKDSKDKDGKNEKKTKDSNNKGQGCNLDFWITIDANSRNNSSYETDAR